MPPITAGFLQTLTPIFIFLLVYLFIILETFPKVVVTLLGASLVIILGVLTQEEAFAFIDLNVIFLLVGMMIIVSILKETGGLNWLAYQCARIVKGDGLKLLLVFAFVTAVVSAFVDNVTTVLFMATLTCTLARQLSFNPVPFLIAEVVSSNVGGTATLIGDPPNILIGSAAKLNFIDFLIHLTPVILLIFPVMLLTLLLFYKDQLKLPEEAREKLANLPMEGVITDKPLLIKSLVVLGVVLLTFVFQHALHLEVGTIALAGAAVLMMFESFDEVWNDVEWTTIFFFIGLFIIVGAVEKVGALKFMADWFFQLTDGNNTVITLSLLWLSGLASAVIDNIPFTTTMIPFLQEIGHHTENIQPLWWALALGACLGGNGTIIGATANVIVIDIARRNGYHIGFWEFFKIGFLILIESLLISSLYLWLRYL